MFKTHIIRFYNSDLCIFFRKTTCGFTVLCFLSFIISWLLCFAPTYFLFKSMGLDVVFLMSMVFSLMASIIFTVTCLICAIKRGIQDAKEILIQEKKNPTQTGEPDIRVEIEVTK